MLLAILVLITCLCTVDISLLKLNPSSCCSSILDDASSCIIRCMFSPAVNNAF